MTDTSPLTAGKIGHIAICGAGLAGRMTAAALSRSLPAEIHLTLIDCLDLSGADIFYGNATAPSAYDFNLSVGVSEPDLVLHSDTAFSWGAAFERWGGRSWIQCFHLPLPVPGTVMFHHYLAQQNIERLEPFLISAVAAGKGVFAHPPEQADVLLSRAEYGYHIDPRSYAARFAAATDETRLREIASPIAAVECAEGAIAGLRLADGQTLTADLYVDCTGPEASLLSALEPGFSGERRLCAMAGMQAADRLGPPRRTVRVGDYGWQSEAPLQGRLARLTVYHEASEAAARRAHGGNGGNGGNGVGGEGEDGPAITVTPGRRASAWAGNCVAMGHSAGIIEPLTPAPIMLLQRDIERLISLIPVSADMAVERREFNRQYAEDYTHAWSFSRALFETDALPDTPYWREARAEPPGDKLARKLAQFRSRGHLVTYDHEPFNPEDWTILHYGMGRLPERHDRVADQAPPAQVRGYLGKMEEEIAKFAGTMPSHDVYMAGLIRYLRKSGER